MIDLENLIKLAAANIVSWTATVFAVVELKDIATAVGIAASVGSVTVSIFSVLWIRQQMVAHRKKNDAPRS